MYYENNLNLVAVHVVCLMLYTITGLDWWTGLLDSFSFLFSFWHMFGQLVVAIVTLNVKYAGEPVYLAPSVILGLCAILSLGIISIVQLPFVLS